MLISKNHGKWVIFKNHRSGMMLSPPCPFPWDQCPSGAWQLIALLEWLQAPGRRGWTCISTHGGSWPPETTQTSTWGDIIVCVLFFSPEANNNSPHATVQWSTPPTPCLTDTHQGRAVRWHCLGPASSQGRYSHLNMRGEGQLLFTIIH